MVEATTTVKTYNDLYPEDIVKRLDQFIIGQRDAKKAVAIAIRNRWRRLRTGDLQHEIHPKNILMIGPTGVGKTEIARRIAHIINAPFIKIEATKFTEVGYVGRDVDSIIRDLVTVAIDKHKEEALSEATEQAKCNVEDIIIDALIKLENDSRDKEVTIKQDSDDQNSASAKNKDWYRQQYRDGFYDETLIPIETKSSIGLEIMTPVGMEDISSQLNNWLQTIPSDKNKSTLMKVADAKKSLLQEEAHALINEEQIKSLAIESVEQSGIVFLDEIDKVVKSTATHSEVSREGVQRDLLPLIEGTTVQTKYGGVNTDHILFIASGAFMGVQPSDMASELQGRLPIRVNLSPLTEKDFFYILSRTRNALTQQYTALMLTEGVDLQFTDGGVQTIASIAFKLNEHSDNIGARRLHAVMEKCLESISYDAHHHKGKTVVVDKRYVKKHLPLHFDEAENLEKWIL
tara:strand:- start:1975 stop:3354 length:1380 start_codon:yes stop_codon:yes gene_type:complete